MSARAENILANLIANRVDITIQNLTVTAGRAQLIEFSIPYFRTGQGFLLLGEGKYKSFADLKAAGGAVTVRRPPSWPRCSSGTGPRRPRLPGATWPARRASG